MKTILSWAAVPGLASALGAAAICPAVVPATAAPACVIAAGPTPDGLLDHERWAVATAVAGRPVDFDACYGRTIDPNDPKTEAEWRNSAAPRRLSAAATTEIVNAAKPRGLTIRGAFFEAKVDFGGAEIGGPLVIEGSRLETSLGLAQARLDSLTIAGSWLKGFVDLGKIETKRDVRLVCRGRTPCNRIDGETSLTAARIGGSLDVVGGALGGLTAPWARVGAPLNLKSIDLAPVPKTGLALDLSNVVVDGTVTLAGVALAGPATLELLEAKGNLLIEEDHPETTEGAAATERKSTVAGGVDLAAAQISKGGLYIQKTRIDGTLNLTGVTTRDSLMLKDQVSIGAVDMLEADIGDSLLIGFRPAKHDGTDPTWEEACREQRAEPWTEIKGRLLATGAKIGGSLEIDRAEIGVAAAAATKDPKAVDIFSANFNGAGTRLSLLVSKCALIENLKLRTTRVADLLSIRGRGVAHLELEGLTYGKFDYNNSDWFDLLDRDREFSTQPYREAAKALDDFGRRSDANDAIYASRDRERDLASCACFCEPKSSGNLARPCAKLQDEQSRLVNCTRFVGLSALKVLIGYGVGLGYFQVLFFMGLFVVIGMAVLQRVFANKGWLWRLAASIDAMIPIISLNQKYRSSLDDVTDQKVLAYIYFHRALGWIFGLFVAAGFAGLTQGG